LNGVQTSEENAVKNETRRKNMTTQRKKFQRKAVKLSVMKICQGLEIAVPELISNTSEEIAGMIANAYHAKRGLLIILTPSRREPVYEIDNISSFRPPEIQLRGLVTKDLCDLMGKIDSGRRKA
jgi:hypothetical protein